MRIQNRTFSACCEFQRAHGKWPNRVRLSPQDYNDLRADAMTWEKHVPEPGTENEPVVERLHGARLTVDPAATELSVYWEEER